MTNFPLDWDMSEYKDVDSTNYVSRLPLLRPKLTPAWFMQRLTSVT